MSEITGHTSTIPDNAVRLSYVVAIPSPVDEEALIDAMAKRLRHDLAEAFRNARNA
jgi:hypothetical protein